ncbi:cupin [Alloscardovia theropitheci]|uniref:Cupin n=1 Tax=Alloscardovia theropitheci TaxID=2496842 RepID=A0A4R0QRI1_9BIFI|nr:cupin [Alloscardovia theropitheci]TCD54963.1 cupin [Alloscardovia theropitheci]
MRIYSSSPVDLFENLYESDSQTVTHLHIARDKSSGWHSVDFTVVVVPISGTVRFSTHDNSRTITVGDIVRMVPGEEHNLEGLGEVDCDLMVIKSKLV